MNRELLERAVVDVAGCDASVSGIRRICVIDSGMNERLHAKVRVHVFPVVLNSGLEIFRGRLCCSQYQLASYKDLIWIVDHLQL